VNTINVIEFLKEMGISTKLLSKLSQILKVLEKYDLYVDVEDIDKHDSDESVMLSIGFSDGEPTIMYIDDKSICLTDNVELTLERFEKLKQIINELKSIGLKISEDPDCKVLIVRVPIE